MMIVMLTIIIIYDDRNADHYNADNTDHHNDHLSPAKRMSQELEENRPRQGLRGVAVGKAAPRWSIVMYGTDIDNVIDNDDDDGNDEKMTEMTCPESKIPH